MGNALAGYGVGAVLATLAIAYLVSVVATLPFGLMLVGAVSFGLIVFSASLVSGDVAPATNDTFSSTPIVVRKNTSIDERLTAAAYGLGLVVASAGLLVVIA